MGRSVWWRQDRVGRNAEESCCLSQQRGGALLAASGCEQRLEQQEQRDVHRAAAPNKRCGWEGYRDVQSAVRKDGNVQQSQEKLSLTSAATESQMGRGETSLTDPYYQ